MVADDVRHRAHRAGDDRERVLLRPRTPARSTDPHAPPQAVAARVPAEYREAYLDGFARARAGRDRHLA